MEVATLTLRGKLVTDLEAVAATLGVTPAVFVRRCVNAHTERGPALRILQYLHTYRRISPGGATRRELVRNTGLAYSLVDAGLIVLMAECAVTRTVVGKTHRYTLPSVG